MQNPFEKHLKTLHIGEVPCQYYDIINCISEQDKSYIQKYSQLPYALRVILESLIRNCDGVEITPAHILSLMDWNELRVTDSVENVFKDIPFKPARVLLQDFTGVPAVVDFAAMRDIVMKLGGDPQKINPLCPVDLVIDHSIQVDSTKGLTHNPVENLNVKTKQKGGRLDSADVHMLKSHQSDLSSINGSFYENYFVNNEIKLYENSPPLPPNTFLVYPNPNPLPLLYQPLPPPHYAPILPPPFYSPPFLAPQPYAPLPIPSLISLPTSPMYPTPQLYQDQPSNNNWRSFQSSYAKTTSDYLKQKTATAKIVKNNDTLSASIKDLIDGRNERQAKISLCYGKDSNKLSLKDINFSNTSDKSTCLICDAVPSTNFRRYTECPFHQHVTDCSDALIKNQMMEFERNKERFEFLKWGAKSFKNMRIIPPGSGIVHQVNLEYLARVVFMTPQPDGPNLLYPDSVVGTDSHTTMINGLGVLGWGVGGIEAESVMLGQAITMEMPEVVGCHITGKLDAYATSTDLVLTVTRMLRQAGLVGKFVEFYGVGVEELSIADRATISNMCPEYGATLAFFPVDRVSLEYLLQTGRSALQVEYIEKYLRAVKMFRDYKDPTQDPIYTQVIEVDLRQVSTCVSGPKRPQDKVSVRDVKSDFLRCLTQAAGFKGFGLSQDDLSREVEISERALELDPDDDSYANAPNGKTNGTTNGDVATGQTILLHSDPRRTLKLRHGSVVIAAITSCTNTSNPSVMLGAGLLAKKAVEAGLKVPLYVKTSLSPGSGVVTHYLKDSLTLPYLERLGFGIVGYGCMTCIGNSGPLHPALVRAIEGKDNTEGDDAKQSPLVVCAVLSGNRNFEGRVHPHTRANYLASPLLVVAYALAGRVDIDFETEPLGYKNPPGSGCTREPVYLRDVWPLRDEIKDAESRFVLPQMFTQVYKSIEKGNENWQNLHAPEGVLYPWSPKSTYIKRPPFFDSMKRDAPLHTAQDRPLLQGARVLLWLGDSVTTDHISPAGSIAKNSPAAKYLMDKGLTPRDFNSYGSRRGNDDVMVRGTFGNSRLVNRLLPSSGAFPSNYTLHFGPRAKPSAPIPVYDACLLYQREPEGPIPLIVLAGKEYGSGSSRDWAAKGPYLLGVRAVIAESFERIHRSNLVGMGILPLQYMPGQSAASLKLVGDEMFNIAPIDSKSDVAGPCGLVPKQILNVKASNSEHTINFEVVMRIDTQIEIEYYENGGILNYMVRKML